MRAVPVLTAIFALTATPALAADPCGPGHMRKAEARSDVLELVWQGTVVDQMAADIADEFAKQRRNVSSVLLSLHSCGGSLRYMQRAIAVLEQIKGTHQVVTKVDRGDTCGSACVPIFLAGTRRIGALTSSFYFHPVAIGSLGDPGTNEARARMQHRSSATEDVLSRYFAGAGLSEDWLRYLRRTLRTHDLWQSGRDLWESKSGVLTETIDNLEPREDGTIDLPNGTACSVKCRG
jgi:hypothetical protein